MGTDIHLIAETKAYDPDTQEDLGWQLVPGPIIDCWSCDGTGYDYTYDRETHTKIFTHDPCRRCAIDPATLPIISPVDDDGWDERAYEMTRYVGPGKTRDSWYSDRNYVVFAVLGNVRNGYGFAGIHTHQPLPYMSDSRRFPDDLSDEGKRWFDVRGGNHSATWVDLRDVLIFDWEQGVHQTGVLDLPAWAEYRSAPNGLPQSWSGDISGTSVRYVHHAEMDRQLQLFRAAHGRDPKSFGEDGILYCTRMQWVHPLSDFATPFLDRMRMLAMQVGEAPTRLVFDFDS